MQAALLHGPPLVMYRTRFANASDFLFNMYVAYRQRVANIWPSTGATRTEFWRRFLYDAYGEVYEKYSQFRVHNSAGYNAAPNAHPAAIPAMYTQIRKLLLFIQHLRNNWRDQVHVRVQFENAYRAYSVRLRQQAQFRGAI
jgi:hypothetical protein